MASLQQISGPGIVGAGAAVALAARMTGGRKDEDESVWVSLGSSLGKLLIKSVDAEKRPSSDLAKRLSAVALCERPTGKEREKIEKPIFRCGMEEQRSFERLAICY